MTDVSDLSGRAAPGPPVDVEVVVLRAQHPGPCVGYRVVRGRLGADQHPDDVAVVLAGGRRPEVSHSTSWRREDDAVVLTYAVLPDHLLDEPAQQLHTPSIVWSGDASRPSPRGLHEHHVVAHAVRHLAQLEATDPGVRLAAQADTSGIWGLIRSFCSLPVDVHGRLPADHG